MLFFPWSLGRCFRFLFALPSQVNEDSVDMSYETILEDRELTTKELACIREQIEYDTTTLGISSICWWFIAKQFNLPYLSVQREGMAMQRANTDRQVASIFCKEVTAPPHMSSSSASHHETVHESGNVQTKMTEMQQRLIRLETTMNDMQQKIAEIHQLCRFFFLSLGVAF